MLVLGGRGAVSKLLKQTFDQEVPLAPNLIAVLKAFLGLEDIFARGGGG